MSLTKLQLSGRKEGRKEVFLFNNLLNDFILGDIKLPL